MPKGLRESEKLEKPIWTPSTKAEQGEHDENISKEKAQEIVGVEVARKVEEASLRVYGLVSCFFLFSRIFRVSRFFFLFFCILFAGGQFPSMMITIIVPPPPPPKRPKKKKEQTNPLPPTRPATTPNPEALSSPTPNSNSASTPSAQKSFLSTKFSLPTVRASGPKTTMKSDAHSRVTINNIFAIGSPSPG